MGCDISNSKAIEKICKIRGIKPEKANFSFICYDLSHISDYTRQIDNETYRVNQKSSSRTIHIYLQCEQKCSQIIELKQKDCRNQESLTITIARTIVKMLGNPIVSTSIHDDDEIMEYSTDPELIHEKYKDIVDLVIDGGYGDNEPSTIVDCSIGEFEIIRQGKGDLDQFL
jgi:tRNA threonylcarbamoyl adenosine modification protein (Sua5/YciO/YrdC/YwlC family)